MQAMPCRALACCHCAPAVHAALRSAGRCCQFVAPSLLLMHAVCVFFSPLSFGSLLPFDAAATTRYSSSSMLMRLLPLLSLLSSPSFAAAGGRLLLAPALVSLRLASPLWFSSFACCWYGCCLLPAAAAAAICITAVRLGNRSDRRRPQEKQQPHCPQLAERLCAPAR